MCFTTGQCYVTFTIFDAKCCKEVYLNLYLTSRRRPERPSISNVRVYYFGFNRPSRLHPSGSCVSSSENLMNFMHFHNASTRNCDHHVLLIMTGNVHKESCHKLLLILVRELGLYIIKTDCSGKMVVAFTIKEKYYLMGSLFCQLALPLSYLYLWY